ncbi:GGDEF domain-containing protein [Fibrobacter sp. UWEL]|uniref:GGDEF domain-containing protein n=1 Tax=Fibrobacter sp. UWEL TaxID=1896209 RepID=UPI0009219914|nr:GGDEF domain-containing protein [Fibrobacter sp. UWEL]SHL13859.1 diguanylate cyclase (GGDEF) domain-containing protein [Fibrobacter sp. UWEL]
MEHLYNLRTVCVGNYIGLMLLVILFFENAWRLRRRTSENVAIMMMVTTCIASCFLDPIAYYVDGIPGKLFQIIAYISNDILFVSYGVICFFWVYFLAVHLEGGVSRRHLTFMRVLLCVPFSLILINHFYPIAFTIDNQGNYVRSIGYYINLFTDAIFVLDGLLLYTRCRRKGGFMKSFPVAGYIVPIAVAVIIQSNFYGVSVISPSIAVGITSILAGLKNENAYRDEQTGVYKRSYMDACFDKIVAKNRVTGFLIHLDTLDSICDEHGYKEVDNSIVCAAAFLNEAVGDMGTVVRFATDKFVVLLNTQADAIIKVLDEEIRNDVLRYNRNSKIPLSIHMSYVKLNKDNSEQFLMLNELNHQLRNS